MGRTLGEFEILAEIGRGGMGAVYQARQASLDRFVALKVLSGTLGLTESSIARFRREAQATARLHHPNIVPVYAQGQEGSIYYYAMELVSGRNLNHIICDLALGRSDSWVQHKAGAGSSSGAPVSSPPSTSDSALAETELVDRGSRASIPTEIGRGMTTVLVDRSSPSQSRFDHCTPEFFDDIARQMANVADALDYAHRNGVIHRDIKPHNLLVGDGGRLCLTDFGLARVLEQPGMTMTGEFIGSPLYMSPEQIRGDFAEVDLRTDVYSLGATLYEWLTLRPPFPGETREQVITRILSGELTEPRALNPQIPVDLETICLKALSNDRGKRYAQASAMRDDLNRYLLRDQIRARRAGILAKAARHIGKRRVAAVIVVALLVVASVTALLIREKKENIVTEQIITSTQAEAEAAREESVQLRREHEDIRSVVQELDMVRQRMEMGQEAAAAIRPMVSGLLQFGDSGNTYTPVTPTQRIGAAYLNSIRTAEVARLRDTDRSQIVSGSAQDHYLRALAEESAQAAVSHLDKCLSLESDHLPARRLRAWIHCQTGAGAAMLADAERIISLSSESGDGYLLRGVARLIQGDPAGCLADVELASTHNGSEEWAPTITGLALAALDRTDDALGRLSRALIIDPNNVTALLARARISLREGHHQAAIVDLTRALEQEPDNAEALEWRGDCYNVLKNYQEAFDDYFKSARISGNTAMTLKVITAALNRDNQRTAVQASANQQPQTGPDSNEKTNSSPTESDPSQMHEWLKDFLDGQPHGSRRLPKPQPSTLNRLLPTR